MSDRDVKQIKTTSKDETSQQADFMFRPPSNPAPVLPKRRYPIRSTNNPEDSNTPSCTQTFL